MIKFGYMIIVNLKGKSISESILTNKEGAMNVQDKPKDTLVRELSELRQKLRFLEEKISKQNCESKQNDTSNSKKVTEKTVWRLPGYWY